MKKILLLSILFSYGVSFASQELIKGPAPKENNNQQLIPSKQPGNTLGNLQPAPKNNNSSPYELKPSKPIETSVAKPMVDSKTFKF